MRLIKNIRVWKCPVSLCWQANYCANSHGTWYWQTSMNFRHLPDLWDYLKGCWAGDNIRIIPPKGTK